MGRQPADGEDRRQFLKRAGVVAGATVWAVPTMQVVRMASAGAQTTGSVVVTNPPPSTSEGPSPLTFTPVIWRIDLDTHGVGVHTISMDAEVSPLTVDELQDFGGRLVWAETEVVLCTDENLPGGLGIDVGDGFLTIGDGFQTTECSQSGMQAAFDAFGLPEAACLFVRAHGVVTEYCAPLMVFG